MPDTIDGIGLPFEEAIRFFAGKANIPTQRWYDVWRAGHSHGFMVAGAASDALLQDIREEVAKGIAGETSLHDFRRSFRDIVSRHGWEHNGEPGWRARIIFETNIAMAQSAGEYARLTDPDTLAVFPYWQYIHSGSRHPRHQHLAWNGMILRADDPWWRTHFPPNGWGCNCRVRPVSMRDLQRMGRHGPDPSPAIVTRPWTNPRTGEVSHVPVGIDPGFDYNPGMAWLDARPQVPAQLRWAERLPPPPPAPPIRAVQTRPASAPGRAPAGIATPAEIGAFIKEPMGALRIGRLSRGADRLLSGAGHLVQLSAETMLKQLRHHPELTPEEYQEQLPLLLSSPSQVLRQSAGRIVLLRSTETDTGRRFYTAAVKATESGDAYYLLSFRRARDKDVRRMVRKLGQQGG